MNPFTIFIPVYNEEKIIVENTERLIAFLDGLKTPYEIIIGSNGSNDRTPELGAELQKKHPQVRFFHTDERGVGNALRKAIPMVRNDSVISVDMDLSVDIDFIRKAATLLTEYDVVVGSKRMGNQERSFIRKAASGAFIFCAMILLGLSFDDYSLAAKAYRKKVLEECADRIDSGTFYVVEVLSHAGRKNYQCVQIPVQCDDRRQSKFNLMHEGVYRFSKLFKLWMRNR